MQNFCVLRNLNLGVMALNRWLISVESVREEERFEFRIAERPM